ncbi:MAG: UTRA domain-containing protein, partial [Hyphomicrobiales bacterium]
LGIDRKTRAFRIDRLLKADGWPIGMSESWISPAVLNSHTPSSRDLDVGSLYTWLERNHGARIAGGQELIEAATATRKLAESLDIAVGAPLLVARRRSHAADGAPIEYAVMHYRADRYRFRVDLVRQ